MKMGLRIALVALVCLSWLRLVEALEVSEVRGILDAAGGSGRSGSIVLSAGSLGQPFQTGRMASGGGYRLTAGFLAPNTNSHPPDPGLTGDFNADGAVDFADFLLFARGYGASLGEAGYDSRFDLDGDGRVGFQDFLAFAKGYGKRK